ncbi:MAG TPA: HAD family hydrolase, partial [Acidimicrobiales bacterium]|nr:HAD family hydrolase [Acidimicrobiales bacterium]
MEKPRLPPEILACLFDLDGVLTRTASVHAAAWKEMFDEFLQAWAERTGEPYVPFDAVEDYDKDVDGKTRADGTRSFLASRGIVLPEGSPDDRPDALTVHGLGNRKDEILLKKLAEQGVEVYEGSIRFVGAVRRVGLGTAVVSSSVNTAEVLEAARIADLFEVRVDGLVAAARGLAGPVNSDDEPETAGPARGHTGQRVLEHCGLLGTHVERLGGG